MKKYKIYVISPNSIIGEILIKGIAKGFEKLGHTVLIQELQDFDEGEIKIFNPDFVFGMDYAHLTNHLAQSVINNLEVPVAHFFIDHPNKDFAHGGNEALFDTLSETNGIIFCWDESIVDVFKNKTYYLPTGIDFDNYKNPPSPSEIEKNIKKATILFAGRPLTDKRERIIAHVARKFPGKLSVYSYKAHFDKSVEEMLQKGYLTPNEAEEYKKCYKGFLQGEKELSAAYHNCDIVLNITMEQGESSMNSRVLESLATGAFLLTDYVRDTVKYFEEDKDFVLYHDLEDLEAKIRKYLANPELRQKIAGKGREKVEKSHTLLQRAETIMKIMPKYLL